MIQRKFTALDRSCFGAKVFVSNLAFGVGWQNLKDHMRQAGNVLRADVFVDYDGRSKGYGTVEFSKPFEVSWSSLGCMCTSVITINQVLNTHHDLSTFKINLG